MPNQRPYVKTHPWLTFSFDMGNSNAVTWMALGEIQSKCEHLAGVPLDPTVAEKMHCLYLAKGAMATTAIEGNTLSQEEVEQRIKGKLQLPPSKEYLGLEIDNIIAATNRIAGRALVGGDQRLTIGEVKEYNQMVLKDLQVEDNVVPGELRDHGVTVGRYRGAPAADCEYLLNRLCAWLSGPDFAPQPGLEIVFGVIKAIVGHLYLAWIHPFGDGNGRTARLLEVRFLIEAGAPTPAAHLLSNFYNQTRSQYYKHLDEASKNGGNIMPFITYAANGLAGQLREQIDTVRTYQFAVTWEHFVHSKFKDQKSISDHRRRHLVLALSEHPDGLPYVRLRRMTGKIAEMYANKTSKTVVRDVNTLIEMGLLVRNGRLIRAKTEVVLAFLPDRRAHVVLPELPQPLAA